MVDCILFLEPLNDNAPAPNCNYSVVSYQAYHMAIYLSLCGFFLHEQFACANIYAPALRLVQYVIDDEINLVHTLLEMSTATPETVIPLIKQSQL